LRPSLGNIKVLSLYWNFITGGGVAYARLLDRIQERAPIELRHLAILASGRQVDAAAMAALDVHRIPVRGSLDPRWIRPLMREIATYAPDLIMTHGFNTHIVASIVHGLSRHPVPCVSSFHGPYHAPTAARRLLAPVFNWTTEMFLRRSARRVVSVTESAKAELVRRGVAAEKITVIHNGVMDTRCAPDIRAAVRRELKLSREALVIGIASRLEPVKGISYLFSAFERIAPQAPEARLVVVGSGPLEEDLRQQARTMRLDDRIIFTGLRRDVDRLLEGMDIFALPSLSEQHSMGLLEAMRAGKAIVATEVGGNPESISAGVDGLLVPPADVEALAHALRRLIASDELRIRLGTAARAALRERFTVDIMLDRTAQWLLDAAAMQRLEDSETVVMMPAADC
jgi:glycosyltransferase involved in cell wall biosynthesis